MHVHPELKFVHLKGALDSDVLLLQTDPPESILNYAASTYRWQKACLNAFLCKQFLAYTKPVYKAAGYARNHTCELLLRV